MILSAAFLLCLLVAVDGSAIKGRLELGDTKRLQAPVELRRSQQQLPLEQHRELTKTSTDERREEITASQKLEDLSQQREEITQIRQEEHQLLAPTKGQQQPARPFEARPQIREEPQLAKGQSKPALAPQPQLATKSEELPAPIQEQQRLEEAPRREEQTPQLIQEQAKLDEIDQQREELHAERPLLRAEQAKGQRPLEIAHREEALKSTETTTRSRATQEQVQLVHDYEQRRLEDNLQQTRYEEPALQQQQQIVQEEHRSGVKGGASASAEAEPYAFDYSVEGSTRRESGDIHGVVRGQYTLQNGDGSQRIVDYIADRDGFRAQVNTGERGTENQQPASVLLRSNQPAAQDISLQLEGKTREFLTAGPPQLLAPEPLPSKTPARPENWDYQPGKTSQQQLQVIEQAPIKGGRAEAQQELISLERAPTPITHQEIKSAQRVEEAIKQQEPLLKLEPQPAELPTKRAPELARSPKALAELKTGPLQARASFESATAHRPVVHAVPSSPIAVAPHRLYHHQPAPVARHHLVPAHRVHVASPVRAYQHAPSRAQLQHDRYPAVPSVARGVPNPRVSFYAGNNYDDEHPHSLAGF